MELIEAWKLELPCTWDENRLCLTDKDCRDCPHQPADDDKVNGKNPPVKIKWEESYGGTYPQCPACGEMPYSFERCVFCGQKFLQEDERLQEYMQPTPEERHKCHFCGGKVVGRRAKSNGHFHGKCEKCGSVVME